MTHAQPPLWHELTHRLRIPTRLAAAVTVRHATDRLTAGGIVVGERAAFAALEHLALEFEILLAGVAVRCPFPDEIGTDGRTPAGKGGAGRASGRIAVFPGAVAGMRANVGQSGLPSLRPADIAADVGELLTVCYEALLRAGARHPALLRAMHAAFARQNAREREAMSTIHALPAAGRVAAFLCRWADKLEHCGMRNDQILLPTSRAEIGGHVGLRLESVSRAMTNLEREQLIRFNSPSRRNLEIPSLNALRRYVHSFADGYR